jgi:thiamine-phosphate diphosphorylase
MVRLARPAIFLVTSGLSRGENDDGWRTAIRSSTEGAAAGIDVVQIREPWLSDRALATLVRQVLRDIQGVPAVVVVNDRPDIALTCGASGVHLRSTGIDAARVRSLLSKDMIVGRSVHSIAEARDAAASGAVDYLFFGTVFRSASKPGGHPVQGTGALRSVCEAVNVPVIAIGGVSLDNVREVAQAGAAGVAAIGLFAEGGGTFPGGLPAIVRRLRAAFA